MYADGPFCRIEITHSHMHGVQIWGVRDPQHRIESARTLVNTLYARTESFHPQWYRGAMRASWYVLVAEITA